MFGCLFVCLFVCMSVCMSVHRFIQFILGTCYVRQIQFKRIVNKIKVYIERINLQLELIRFRKKNIHFINAIHMLLRYAENV